MHCSGPLGVASRAVECFVAGGGHYRRGRACHECWSRRLLGSLLYRALVCKKAVCECGWCADWRALKAKKG
jgi:hypothetical protein